MHLSFQAVQEAEMGRIAVHANQGKTVCGILSQWKKLDVVACACHPSCGGKLKIGLDKTVPDRKQDPHLQNNQSK
jgi:hypothetical protein